MPVGFASPRSLALPSLALGACLVLAACPRDKKTEDKVPVDSTLTQAMTQDSTPPADLSTLTSNIPEAAPDTFKRKTAAQIAREEGVSTGGASTSRIPDAPEALMTAVQREQSFTRFCYQEFGQKVDPSLAGNVAMIVSISGTGVSGTEVGNSRWTSSAGKAVNQCLSQKARQAWKVEPGAVKPGRYVVQLSFKGA